MRPMRAFSGMMMLPTKRSSSPARMRSSVVLPQPEAPISTVILSGTISRTKSRIAGTSVPSTPTWVFSSMRISNRLVAPARRAAFKGVYQEIFAGEYEGDKGEGVAKNRRHIEKLEIEMELETDAVRPAKQFNHEHDLPDQGNA